MAQYESEFLAPDLDIRYIVGILNDELPDLKIKEADLSQPMKVDKVRVMYEKILTLFGFNIRDVLQNRQFEQPGDFPELYDDATSTIQLTLMIHRILHSCHIKQFTVDDIVSPKVKRTKSFLSAIINFFLFYKGIQQDNYLPLKAELDDAIHHADQLRNKNDVIEIEIEKLKIEKVHNEDEAQKLKKLIDDNNEELRQKTDVDKDLKKKSADVNLQISEGKSKLALIMSTIATKQEEIKSFDRRIGQSPARLKLENMHLQNKLSQFDNEIEDKLSRLHEIKSKSEQKGSMLEKLKAPLIWVNNIKLDMEREKAADAEFSQKNEQIKEQFMFLRDAERREAVLKNEIEAINEKTLKMDLQYKAQIKCLENDVAEAKTDKDFINEINIMKKQIKELKEGDAECEMLVNKELSELEERTNMAVEVTKNYCLGMDENIKKFEHNVISHYPYKD